MEYGRKYDNLQQNVILKKEFLDNMQKIDKNADGTIVGTEIVLRRFGEYEKKFNKDIYEFTLEEFDTMFYGFQFGSNNDAGRVGSVLKKYLIFAQSKKFGNLSLNYQAIFNKKKLDQYVWKNKYNGKIFSFDQVKKITSLIKNPRDKLICWLWFMGVKGKYNEDIRMLKKINVDIGGKFIVTNKKIIENIPDFIINLIKETNDTNEYYSIDVNGNLRDEPTPLKDNDFLLRPLQGKGKVSEEDCLTDNSLRQIFSKIKKSCLIDFPEFSPLNIYKSGMLYYFNKYLEKNNISLSDKRKNVKKTFNDFMQKYYSDIEFSDMLYYDFMQKYNIFNKNT